MGELLAFLTNNQEQAVLTALIAAGLGLILALPSLVFAFLSWRENRHLFGNSQREGLKRVLKKHLEKAGQMQAELKSLGDLVKEMRQKDLRHFQKAGLVRFNPFGDTGSDQSFTLALLDEEGSGVVISSLHSRDQTRLYAKPVKKSQAESYSFSEEEKQAVEEALAS